MAAPPDTSGRVTDIDCLGRRAGMDRQAEAAGTRTDDDGRIRDLLSGTLEKGIYRMRFETQAYHQRLGIQGFYPEAVITFIVDNPSQHYHIPLLLSPFAYSTYRGS